MSMGRLFSQTLRKPLTAASVSDLYVFDKENEGRWTDLSTVSPKARSTSNHKMGPYLLIML